jgi:hypothetical protein
MIEIYTGKCGTGKTLRLADKMVEILARNERWYKKTGTVRAIATNSPLDPEFVKLYPEGRIINWKDPLQLVQLRDCDIFWDEISTHMDATQWATLPLEVKRFLQQHRKKGIDIFGTTQTFASVDVSMRRLVDNLYICYKIIGSRNPSPTKPPVKHIWGFIWMRQLDPMSFEDEKPKHIGFDWLFITKQLCAVYDTTQEIEMGVYPALKHIERHCSKLGCDYVSVSHR